MTLITFLPLGSRRTTTLEDIYRHYDDLEAEDDASHDETKTASPEYDGEVTGYAVEQTPMSGKGPVNTGHNGGSGGYAYGTPGGSAPAGGSGYSYGGAGSSAHGGGGGYSYGGGVHADSTSGSFSFSISSCVLYGCETWSLPLREEHRLRVFENRVLRRIFGLKRDEVTGGWRKLRNEELRDLYSSPSIIRIIKSGRMRWAGHVARKWEQRNAYRLPA
jgi:hypothetical protein